MKRSTTNNQTTAPPHRQSDSASKRPQVSVTDHRVRQACIASLLDKTMGTFAHLDPKLWERRAYLMIVGLIYERLSTNESEISTDELVKLSKALAENRRVASRAAAPKSEGNGKLSENGELPESFARIVRGVYGTNLADTVSKKD